MNLIISIVGVIISSIKKLLYLFLFIAVLGCEKEPTEFFKYPSTLVSYEYKVLTNVRLFTKNGQIKDNALIENYLIKYSSGLFYPNKDVVVPISRPDTVIYQTKDTVLFPLPGIWGTRLPKQVGGYLYFYMPDTLTGYLTMQQIGPFKDIISQIGLHKPYYKLFGSSLFGSQYQLIFDAFIAKGNPNRLEFPQITYRISRRTNRSYSWSSLENYNNIFDLNVTKLLQEGDTLAIQESNIIYKPL